jgi:hypothetical protein
MTETVQKYRHLDYEVLIHKSQHHAVMRWCEEQHGPRWESLGNRSGVWSVYWAGRDHYDQYRFCFALEQDLLLFVLRWA